MYFLKKWVDVFDFKGVLSLQQKQEGSVTAWILSVLMITPLSSTFLTLIWKKRGFDREEIWYNRDRSEELFWEMMDEVHNERSF